MTWRVVECYEVIEAFINMKEVLGDEKLHVLMNTNVSPPTHRESRVIDASL